MGLYVDEHEIKRRETMLMLKVVSHKIFQGFLIINDIKSVLSVWTLIILFRNQINIK
jgi:hypothetical protein